MCPLPSDMATDERPKQFTHFARALDQVILEIISLGVHMKQKN
jgi:hypothetical protein